MITKYLTLSLKKYKATGEVGDACFCIRFGIYAYNKELQKIKKSVCICKYEKPFRSPCRLPFLSHFVKNVGKNSLTLSRKKERTSKKVFKNVETLVGVCTHSPPNPFLTVCICWEDSSPFTLHSSLANLHINLTKK